MNGIKTPPCDIRYQGPLTLGHAGPNIKRYPEHDLPTQNDEAEYAHHERSPPGHNLPTQNHALRLFDQVLCVVDQHPLPDLPIRIDDGTLLPHVFDLRLFIISAAVSSPQTTSPHNPQRTSGRSFRTTSGRLLGTRTMAEISTDTVLVDVLPFFGMRRRGWA